MDNANDPPRPAAHLPLLKISDEKHDPNKYSYNVLLWANSQLAI